MRLLNEMCKLILVSVELVREVTTYDVKYSQCNLYDVACVAISLRHMGSANQLEIQHK